MRWLLALMLALPAISQNSLKIVENDLSELSAENISTLAKDIGKMCEFAASRLVSLEYDPAYFYLAQNLTYGKNRRKITGELDIVVFSKKTQQAVKLYEVKCRNDGDEAYDEAARQLKRFKNNVDRCIRNRQPIRITDGQNNYSCGAFIGTKYRVLMPNDSAFGQEKAEHFNLSLSQVYQLQTFSNTLLAKLH